MIQYIKELFFGKAPVLWFKDERVWEVTECESMPSLIGMRLPTPLNGKKVTASSLVEFRTLQPTKVEIGGNYLTVETQYLSFNAQLVG